MLFIIKKNKPYKSLAGDRGKKKLYEKMKMNQLPSEKLILCKGKEVHDGDRVSFVAMTSI